MVVIRDITSGIKYEKLKLHSQLADMLTATISHDMRTPLNAIISLSKNLITDIEQNRT
jgi:signal transduction histidine kinase